MIDWAINTRLLNFVFNIVNAKQRQDNGHSQNTTKRPQLEMPYSLPHQMSLDALASALIFINEGWGLVRHPMPEA